MATLLSSFSHVSRIGFASVCCCFVYSVIFLANTSSLVFAPCGQGVSNQLNGLSETEQRFCKMPEICRSPVYYQGSLSLLCSPSATTKIATTPTQPSLPAGVEPQVSQGESSVFPQVFYEYIQFGHVHSSAHTLAKSPEYAVAYQSPLWMSHSPNFSF